MAFPLYDLLLNETKGKPELTNEEKKKTIADIKKLDQDGADNLYLIIRYAAHLDNDTKMFNAKYNRKGVVFNLDSFSDQLQQMIAVFVQKHLTQTHSKNIEIVFE